MGAFISVLINNLVMVKHLNRVESNQSDCVWNGVPEDEHERFVSAV